MSQEKQMMLRAVAPSLFNSIISGLANYNIHLNDVQANAIKKEDGLDVTVLFGEHFNQYKSHFFTYDDINSDEDDEIKRFVNDIAEACKEVMIADYFKMIKT